MAKRFLVTGGAGFIGSHLVDRLMSAAHPVTVVDDLSTGSLSNLRTWLGHPDFQFIQGTVEDHQTLAMAVERCDVVVHLAALVSVALTVKDPPASFANNAHGTFAVFEAARRAGTVESLVYASSAAVYGHADRLPVTEDTLPAPLSPYAADKLYAESLAQAYAYNYGIPCFGLRFFNVYGPRQNPTSSYSGVISVFMDRIISDRPVEICGDGEQTRDFIHVSDVVEAILAAALHGGSEPRARVLNVGCGQRWTINQLCQMLHGILGATRVPTHIAARAGEVRHSQASIDLATQVLRWEPRVALADGLSRLAEEIRSQNVAEAVAHG